MWSARWSPRPAVSVLYKEEIDASDNIVSATNAKAAAYTQEVCSAQAAVGRRRGRHGLHRRRRPQRRGGCP